MKTIIKQAETFRRALKFTHIKSGEIIDLDGCTAYSQMRKKPGDEWVADAECAIDTVNGIVMATWSAAQTADFPVGKLGYDIWLVYRDEQKPIYTETIEVVKPYTVIGD